MKEYGIWKKLHYTKLNLIMLLDETTLVEFEALMCDKLKYLWEVFLDESVNGLTYLKLEAWLEVFKPYGLTFDYGLDSDPYDFEIIK